jgi:PKD repeat protein
MQMWQAMRRFVFVVVAGSLVVGCSLLRAQKETTGVPAGPLLVSASAEPDRGDAPLRVRFTAEVYEGDAAVAPQFEWDFADGSRKQRGAEVEHTFTQPGEYKVTVEARDRTGRRGRDELIVTVEPLFGPSEKRPSE